MAKYEAGSFDGDVVAADIVQAQEARLARSSVWWASWRWRTSF